jgi:hypothetical protein
MLERTFLKEQVKKREEHQKKEHNRPREERGKEITLESPQGTSK